MPAKGKTLKHGERYNPITKELWKRFVLESGIDIDFKSFRAIIESTLELMREAVANDEAGIEMYNNLGHFVVTKYKSNKTPIDWPNSNKLGKRIPLLNLHSFGYIYHIKWFKIGIILKNSFIYKFEPYRILKRQVAQNVKAGKKYHPWQSGDYWSTTKMERSFRKLYKTDS